MRLSLFCVSEMFFVSFEKQKNVRSSNKLIFFTFKISKENQKKMAYNFVISTNRSFWNTSLYDATYFNCRSLIFSCKYFCSSSGWLGSTSSHKCPFFLNFFAATRKRFLITDNPSFPPSNARRSSYLQKIQFSVKIKPTA